MLLSLHLFLASFFRSTPSLRWELEVARRLRLPDAVRIISAHLRLRAWASAVLP
jgi:hypothetical protein